MSTICARPLAAYTVVTPNTELRNQRRMGFCAGHRPSSAARTHLDEAQHSLVSADDDD